MSAECTSEEVGFILCLHHYDVAEYKCRVAYCVGCGKDLYRECEREAEE